MLRGISDEAGGAVNRRNVSPINGERPPGVDLISEINKNCSGRLANGMNHSHSLTNLHNTQDVGTLGGEILI